MEFALKPQPPYPRAMFTIAAPPPGLTRAARAGQPSLHIRGVDWLADIPLAGRAVVPGGAEYTVPATEASRQLELDARSSLEYADLPNPEQQAPRPRTNLDPRLLWILLCVHPPGGLAYWLLTRRKAG